MLTIGIPDLISPSYFPAVAAVDLGYFADEGIAAEIELVFPVDRAMDEMRDGRLAFVGGCAHSVTHAFPQWRGVKLVAALSQNTYWFLVVRPDLHPRRGDLTVLRNTRIGAAPMVDLALKRMLRAAGIDETRDSVEVVPVPREFLGSEMNFGLAAAKALEAGLIDGFWANGMGTEVAVQSETGVVVIDARRGDGPRGSDRYTFPALATSERLIHERPEEVAAAVRAIVRAQSALSADSRLAEEVGRRRFPTAEAKLISGLIARDAPFYQATISEETVSSLTQFQQDVGLLERPVRFEDVVATAFGQFWSTDDARAAADEAHAE